MSIYSVWPYFAEMALLLLIAASPLFGAADVPPNPGVPRISALDGLRGFLALGVFFHHGAIYHRYLSDGVWSLPPSRFYSLIGQVGVAMFFMITGYLFWSRIVAERGRPDWLQLYIGRVFRIGPLYLFAIACAAVIVLTRVGLHLNVSVLQLSAELGRFLSLGLIPMDDINGYPDSELLLAGVTWTLRYEWYFYLSLPGLALVAGRSKLHLPFAVVMLTISLMYLTIQTKPSVSAPLSLCIALFLVGMTCGSLVRTGMIAKIADPLRSLAVVILICTVFIIFDSSHNVGATLLLGGAFYLIASGCSLFGLLTSRAARRLGNMSYGIYLLQGLVLTIVFSLNWTRDTALLSPLGHWSMLLLCGILLVVVATVVHVAIERTGIEIGKRLGRPWRRSVVI